MPPTCETLPLGAAGLGDASLLGSLDNPEINPNPHKNQAPSADRARLQFLARRLHALGPKPLVATCSGNALPGSATLNFKFPEAASFVKTAASVTALTADHMAILAELKPRQFPYVT